MSQSACLEDLVTRLDAAVETDDPGAVCAGVKAALEELVSCDASWVPPSCDVVTESCYARRLLHRDPMGRYTVIAMTWGPGQGTPLHDHAGSWCVECVYRGKILVTSYDLDQAGSGDAGGWRFHQEGKVEAVVGEAGALIPPFEYHTIRNVYDETAITIHVYKGEMLTCHVFHPTETEGVFRRETKQLAYANA